ncbi:MAG: SGNH/GDSL hydrolase family protein [bacterium]
MVRPSAVKSVPFVLSMVVGAGCVGAPVSGVVYDDTNRSSVSQYAQSIEAGDLRVAGVPVSLFGASTEATAISDVNGAVAFAPATDGTYLLSPDVDAGIDSTSNNAPKRLPQAIREGHVHMVHFGDSLGVVGPSEHFPERLAEHLSAIVPTTVENVAVGGSQTWDWLPGGASGFFEHALAPRLADADVVTITLGGNDLDVYLGNPPDYDPAHILQRFLENPEYLLEIYPNVATIVAAIRDANATCDIVYVIYPNYANSTVMKGYTGELQPLASLAFGAALSLSRQLVAEYPGVVVADMYGALGNTWLDPYLIDEVHLSSAGHQAFADEIFRALGGVDVVAGGTAQRQFGFDGLTVPADEARSAAAG